jgi:DNA-binding transcriptional LysR family regulator
VLCAAADYITRRGLPARPQELREHPRLAFSEAVSPGDWTLQDGRGRSYVIDGPAQLLANNMQLLLAASLEGASVAYGPSFLFGESLRAGALVQVLPECRTVSLGIHTIVPSSRYVPSKVRHLVDRLAADFGAEAAWNQWTDASTSGSRGARPGPR